MERCHRYVEPMEPSLSSIHSASSAVNQSEINHWAKVAVDLEVAGEIDSLFYERARAFAFGEPDPTPHLPLVIPQEETAVA